MVVVGGGGGETLTQQTPMAMRVLVLHMVDPTHPHVHAHIVFFILL